MSRLARKVLRAVANYDPDYYDMYADASEALFARLYLELIRPHADRLGLRPPASVLDAGCQAGRLAVPLAAEGYRVTGIDTSGFALRRAQAHAKAAGASLECVQGDILDVLGRQRRQYDLVLCTEVIYQVPKHRDMLAALAKAVRPGGLLCVSHRSQFYYLVEALRQSDLTAAAGVMARSEGPFPGGAYYNWQTEPELRRMYGELGLRWLASHPIDATAWLTGLDLAALSREQQDAWLAAELALAREGGTYGRYHLVIAEQTTT